MPEQFENGRKLDGKSSSQGFDAKEVYLHPKNRSVSCQKRLKMFSFRHFQVFTGCSFQNVPVRVPFSKPTVFKLCRQKMCRFRVNGRSIRRIFHCFQNVPASYERSLRILHQTGTTHTGTHNITALFWTDCLLLNALWNEAGIHSHVQSLQQNARP